MSMAERASSDHAVALAVIAVVSFYGTLGKVTEIFKMVMEVIS